MSAALHSKLAEFAPAKVNLHLHVLGRREDGYHLLDSLAAFADVGDQLSVHPANTLSLQITGPFASTLATEPDNLVLRAARSLADLCGAEPRGALILEKNLPVASGIGGGSADAAAALRLLCRFWSIEPDPADLSLLAAKLGADVPVCLRRQPAIMAGIGEILVSVPRLPNLGLLLVNPGVAVATAAVFKVRRSPYSRPLSFDAMDWESAQALIAILREGGNDLEEPALNIAPEIGAVLSHLRHDSHCLLARMSGSGATCFGLFPSPAEAAAASTRLAGTGWWSWGGGFYRP